MKQILLGLVILLACSFVLLGCTEKTVTPDANVPTNGTVNNNPGNTNPGTTVDPITSQTTDATSDPADVNIGEIFE